MLVLALHHEAVVPVARPEFLGEGAGPTGDDGVALMLRSAGQSSASNSRTHNRSVSMASPLTTVGVSSGCTRFAQTRADASTGGELAATVSDRTVGIHLWLAQLRPRSTALPVALGLARAPVGATAGGGAG